ncbi:MAG TPA: hypothetical protein VGR10_03105, partial [Thermoleophilaceae bacterium]|nr:hypothetical protein [Thermoleophilaceae bacterium]
MAEGRSKGSEEGAGAAAPPAPDDSGAVERPPPAPPAAGLRPTEAIGGVHVKAPTRGNRRLEALFRAANADDQLKAWWHMQHVNAGRLGMSDHSWVHVQIVVNIALRLLRLLVRRGVEPAVARDHGMSPRDAEVVVAAAT